MSEPLDLQLLTAVKKGDPDAVNEFVVKFRRPLYKYALNYLGNEFDADDVTQEVLLKAIKALPTFKGDAAIGTWLYRILVNACIDYRRKVNRHPVTSLVKPAGLEDESVAIEVKDSRPLPEEEVEQVELKAFIKKALTQLSAEHRTIVILHDLQGFKYHEIAAITKTSLGTVKSRLFYARQELRKLLEPFLNEEV